MWKNNYCQENIFFSSIVLDVSLIWHLKAPQRWMDSAHWEMASEWIFDVCLAVLPGQPVSGHLVPLAHSSCPHRSIEHTADRAVV